MGPAGLLQLRLALCGSCTRISCGEPVPPCRLMVRSRTWPARLHVVWKYQEPPRSSCASLPAKLATCAVACCDVVLAADRKTADVATGRAARHFAACSPYPRPVLPCYRAAEMPRSRRAPGSAAFASTGEQSCSSVRPERSRWSEREAEARMLCGAGPGAAGRITTRSLPAAAPSRWQGRAAGLVAAEHICHGRRLSFARALSLTQYTVRATEPE